MSVVRNIFPSINRAYNRTFRPGKLSVGLALPLESYAIGALPSMRDHLARVQLAEALGFAAAWLREIGINHVALNLRFNQADTETTLRCLGSRLLPDFHTEGQACKRPY